MRRLQGPHVYYCASCPFSSGGKIIQKKKNSTQIMNHATELSKHIWSLKDQKITYQIKWRKIKQARSYSHVSKRCNLCLWETFFIIHRPEMSTLNSRNELISGCRHARKFLLKMFFLLVMTTVVYCSAFPNIFDYNRYFWQSPDDCFT